MSNEKALKNVVGESFKGKNGSYLTQWRLCHIECSFTLSKQLPNFNQLAQPKPGLPGERCPFYLYAVILIT